MVKYAQRKAMQQREDYTRQPIEGHADARQSEIRYNEVR